jgi:hypothetical protein
MKDGYYIEWGEYSSYDDQVIWTKRECSDLEDAISYVYYRWNTRIYTSLNQITLIEGDNKYDWNYIKNNYLDIDYLDIEKESCGYPPAIP